MPPTILMADDDDDDRELARSAIQDERIVNAMRFVVDGQDLLDYLRREGPYAASPGAETDVDAPRPALILLDLNMPRKDGREALAEIKADDALRAIPVVVLTTSKAEEDVIRTYELGANSYISKPVTLTRLIQVMQYLTKYWFDVVDLPSPS
jgi:CheY-like chemotaxis protein